MSATELQKRESPRLSVRQLWCEGCGYGVVVRRDPPEYPMCRQATWQERPPLARYN